jgi:hypothetical protein
MRWYTPFVSRLAPAKMTSPAVSKMTKSQDVVTRFERAKGARTEETQALQASINRGEIELSNLSKRMGKDFALTTLYRQLTFEIEMSKGTLKQQATAKR